jgi:hypothetical protein
LYSKTFSVRLQPLEADVAEKIFEHAVKFNSNLPVDGDRIPLPKDLQDIPTDPLDLLSAVFELSQPCTYQSLLNLEGFDDMKVLGHSSDDWSKADQYKFVKLACDMLAASPSFKELAQFFVLEIRGPWLPKNVAMWDAPGLGDGRFSPLVQHAMLNSQVIIPYNKGMPIAAGTIIECMQLLVAADPKHLETHPPMFLLFEKPGRPELQAYGERAWAGEQPDESELAQHYCRTVRRDHYCNEVLMAVEERMLGSISSALLTTLFAEIRNTLMVLVDPYNPAAATSQALLHDRKLHSELVNRASFRSVNVWMHACACYIYQLRNLARAEPKVCGLQACCMYLTYLVEFLV